MIDKIIEILKSNEKLIAWNIKSVTTNSYQLYFIKQELDMNREVNTLEYVVNIFTKETISKKEMIGSSSFVIYPSMEIEEIKAKIEEQIGFCKYATVPSYKFPKRKLLKPISKEVLFDGKTLKEAAFIVADSLFEADKYDHGYINSSEIYINHIATKYYDSNDNHYIFDKAYGQIEFVVTWKDENKEEIELSKFLEISSLNGDQIKIAADKLFSEANNRSKATRKFDYKKGLKVSLTNDLVVEFFNYFKRKINVNAIYRHISNYEIGNAILASNKADKLSMTLEPTMPNSTKGAPFDEEGVALRKVEIIHDNLIKSFHGSSRITQYLHKQVVGSFENMVVSGGTITDEMLKNEDYLEIVAASDFYIDTTTGNFGAEIRLAYLHKKGQETIPLTGLSISGSIDASKETLRFSKEVIQQNNYIGPKFVILDNVNVLGDN